MTEIDDRLRDHYRAFELSSSQVSTITNVSEKNSFPFGAFFTKNIPSFTWVAAALLLLSVSVGIHDYGTNSERTSRTLQEAAMNHSTRLQLEFEANTIAEIDEHMSQLHFSVQLPFEFKEQYSVLGARYCTINGELAAHVKFIDRETEKQVSLFMTRSVDDLQKINNTSKRVDGVNVKLWNESGFFYAMASRLPNSPQEL